MPLDRSSKVQALNESNIAFELGASYSLLLVILDHLHPNPNQPRREISEDELKELCQSIRTNGVLQPILVRPAESPLPPDHFIVIAGHRRVEAMKRLHQAATTEHEKVLYNVIPAQQRHGDEKDDDARLALVENVQRVNLSPVDEALGLVRLRELNPELKTAKDIATVTGLKEDRVRRLLRLNDAPQVVKDGVSKGILIPVKGPDGKPLLTDSGKEKRQHVRLEMIAALEFQKLHKHLLGAMQLKAADARVAKLIERVLKERWGEDRIVELVKSVIEGKEPPRERPTLTAFKSTPKQFVLYRERLTSLSQEEREHIREELLTLLEQLEREGGSETATIEAALPKVTSNPTSISTLNPSPPRV